MKHFNRRIKHKNIRIMRYYLRRHSDIDANSFRMLTYHELFDVYQNAIWFDNVFRLYFGKPYFFSL